MPLAGFNEQMSPNCSLVSFPYKLPQAASKKGLCFPRIHRVLVPGGVEWRLQGMPLKLLPLGGGNKQEA